MAGRAALHLQQAYHTNSDNPPVTVWRNDEVLSMLQEIAEHEHPSDTPEGLDGRTMEENNEGDQ